MQAIVTRFFGKTAHRGPRIHAASIDRAIYVPYAYGLHDDQAHAAAALELIRQMGWNGPAYGSWFQGATKDGFVCVASGGLRGSRFVNQIL